MRAMWTVALKEIKDNLRDRRALTSSLLFGPLIGPLVMTLMLTTISQQAQEKAQAPLQLPIVGVEYAQNLVAFLKRQGVEVLAAPPNPEQAVRNKKYDVVLRIPEKYPQQWRSGEPASVEIITDRSQQQAQLSRNRLQALLSSYSQQTGSLRLYLRGIDPTIAQAVRTREMDLSTPDSQSALVFGVLPFFVLMTVFIGGMYLAIDTTAGERERQSLEPLLITAVPRWQIMAGKLTATFCFCVLTLVVALLAFALSAQIISSNVDNIQPNLSPRVLLSCFAVVLPVALIASSLQTIIAAFSKGFREAQTYLSFLQLVPMVPGIWLMVSPLKEQFWMSWVPLLSQSVIINQLIKGETIELTWALSCIASSALLGLLLAVVAARLYSRPNLVFNS
ncbi:ABC transporter permease [bacterium SCSIO 12696]|nr:ABC transporter permease [bacterium SCSIO 12696]